MSGNAERPVDSSSDGDDFLLNASEPSLAAIWDNPEDEIYAELLDAIGVLARRWL